MSLQTSGINCLDTDQGFDIFDITAGRIIAQDTVNVYRKKVVCILDTPAAQMQW